MRAFIAIDVPKELKDKVISVQKRLADYDIKLVEPENLHFCLKFLGDMDPKLLPKLKAIVDAAAKSFEPFDIEIHGMGSFPSPTYIKVIWLGVKAGKNELTGLAELIDNKTAELGFTPENRAFEAHLTLGRVRSARYKTDLLELLKKNKDLFVGVMKAASIQLIESELTPDGPKYTIVHEATLGSE